MNTLVWGLSIILLAVLATLFQGENTGGGPVPVIDISALLAADSKFQPDAQAAARLSVIERIGEACRDTGFLYVSGTGVPADLTARMEGASRAFFARPEEEKRKMEMRLGGSAWRGWFALGEELTSGKADQKEGIYFGVESQTADPARPLIGANLWPDGPGAEQFKLDVQTYQAHMRRVSTVVMGAIASHLYGLRSAAGSGPDGGATEAAFRSSFEEPTELFRIFGYPAPSPTASIPQSPAEELFGVAEHTDYGYITVLHQDNTGGLQVRGAGAAEGTWVDVPPVQGTFVVNLGDALEHHSDGYFRATPHRVLQARRSGGSQQQRVSFPYFFDPNMQHAMKPIELAAEVVGAAGSRRALRWDGEQLDQFSGEYGEYLLKKISRVFPPLFAELVRPTMKQSNEDTDTATKPTVTSTTTTGPDGDYEVTFDYDGGANKDTDKGEETRNGETEAEFNKRKKKETDDVFDWTRRLHEQKGALAGDEKAEEEALRLRMEKWMEDNK